MDTQLIDHPSTILTSPTGEAVIPAPLLRYNPTVAKAAQIKELLRLPDLTVVATERIDTLLSHKAFLRALADRMDRTPEPSKIVFLFTSKAKAGDARKLATLFEYFARPGDLEVAPRVEAVEDAFREALAKMVAARKRTTQALPHQDALRKVKQVIDSTSDLRVSSGKLSANRVATVFGIPVAELATLIGRSRQAVSKTPDADSLQPLLRPFERVARLRAVLSGDEFRKWLHFANDQLGDRTPLELTRDGKIGAIADLVEDLLTGSPT
jgi:hypothetical protein